MGELGKQLKNWVKLPLAWLGRISEIKMNVLPGLLFYFFNLSMLIPEKMISSLQ